MTREEAKTYIEAQKDSVKIEDILTMWRRNTYTIQSAEFNLVMRLIEIQANNGPVAEEDLTAAITYLEKSEQNAVVRELMEKLRAYKENQTMIITEESLLDSETLEFNEDIIVADPEYLLSAEQNELKGISISQWGVKGIEHEIPGHNWDCYAYNNQNTVGHFNSVSRKVCVVSYKDVLRMNPEFDATKFCCMIVKNFRGIAQVKVDLSLPVTRKDKKLMPDCYISLMGINSETEKEIAITTCAI